MSEKELVLRSTINFYCFKGFYRSMQNAALEGVRLYPGDQKYRFYYGASLAFEGRLQESIRELDAIHEHRELNLGCLLALIYAHRQCKSVDKEAVAGLEATLRENRKTATDVSLYFAGLFLVFVKKYEKARDYVDRMYKMSPSLREGQIIKGWLELKCAKEPQDVSEAGKHFDVAAAKFADPEAMLGKAAVAERLANYVVGIEYLNKAIVTYNSFIPAFIEKIKLHVALKDWEEASDVITRTLALDRHCIDAQRYSIFHCLVWESYREDQALSKLNDLLASIELREPKNVDICLETARLFSRLANRNKEVLHLTLKFAERAAMLDANNTDALVELGFQCILMGKNADALRHFKNATKLDESTLSALVGLLYCNILADPSNVDALEQLETLEEFNQAQGLTNELLYICALSGERRGKTETQVIAYLDKVTTNLLESIKGLPMGLDFYLTLNPELVSDIVRLYLDYAPADPIGLGQPLPHVMSMVKDLLSPVVNACPSLKEPLFLMANLKYLSGDTSGAVSLLEKCLDADQSFSNGHLLKAKLLVAQGQWQTASQCLDMALSHNFQIREDAEYVLTKATMLKHEKKYEEAIKCLQNASKSTVHSKLQKTAKAKRNKISQYLLLVELYDLLEQPSEAGKLLDELEEEFKGSSNEGRILVSRAQSFENKGATEQALGVLRSITTEHGEYFIKSRERMAHIYLKYRKDRRLYASCYRDILEKVPTTQSYLMLGDAYMNVLEPERAIEIYEQCLKKNPKDGVLTRKVGQALVKTHLFEKAVTYYKAAIKTSGHSTLRFDLAHLLFRMKRYPESRDVIQAAIEKLHQSGQDLTSLEWESRLLYLLSQVQLVTGSKDIAITTLQETYAVHSKVMRRVPVEQPDMYPEQKKLAIKIGSQLADFLASYQEFDRAKQTLKEMLSIDSENIKILGDIAKLEMTTNNFEEAQRYTSRIVKFAPDDDTSIYMLADLMFRKNDLDGALEQFYQLLEKKPTSFSAMARYIEVARRVGKLDTVSGLLERAERHSPRCASDPKYSYCKGLLEWYTGSSSDAMRSFNAVRTDSDFGIIASFHMIEICINPDNEVIGGETFEQSGDAGLTPMERMSAHENSIKTAEKILADIRPKVGEGLEYKIMFNFVLLARRNKVDTELALSEFLRVLSNERTRDNIAATLGAATAHMVLRQTPKARNLLKRVAKLVWNYSDAETLEKCWLLLADIYCQASKYDMAAELIKRCITFNKSCTKAYEYLGLVMEKEQSYRDACDNYEICWKLTAGNNPVIGFKLAFNFLKAKKYVEAVDICREILDKYPEYPRIRKEILDKARSYLKF